MNVTLAGVVLFLHISVAIAAFMVGGVLHTALQMMPRAATVQEMRPWARVVHRLDPLFPFLALALLGLGAWLVHLEGDEGVGWSSGWVITAVVALVVVEAASGALLAPRAKALVADIQAAADGPVPDAIRAQAKDPVIWNLAHVATVGFLGVVFVMAAKPTGWLAAVVVAVACALGVVVAQAQLRALPSAADGAVPAQRTGAGSTARATETA